MSAIQPNDVIIVYRGGVAYRARAADIGCAGALVTELSMVVAEPGAPGADSTVPGPKGDPGDTGPAGPAGTTDYNDLTNKPTLGTAAATNSTAYATAAQGALAASALQPAGNGSNLTGLTKAQVGLANVDNTADSAKPVSTAQQTALNAKANLAGAAFTGAVTANAGGIGYATGAGGTVTQATNKSTGATLNKLCGEVTMNGAALAAATIVSFTLTNSQIAATDVLVLNHVTTGTRGAYTLNAQCQNGSAVIYVRNNTAGSLSEAIVLRFAVIKGVTA